MPAIQSQVAPIRRRKRQARYQNSCGPVSLMCGRQSAMEMHLVHKSAAATQVLATAQDLSKQSASLRSEIDKFLQRVRAA